MLLKDIKAMHLQDVIEGMETGYSNKRKVKTIYNKMYAYALKNDLATKNYAEFVTVPPDTKPINPKHPFTDDEIKAFMKRDGIQIHIAKILLFTGMRIGELLAMETKNIFFDKDYMIGGLKSEAGKNRIIPISKYAKPSIEALLDINEKMFIFDAGITYNVCKKYWNENIIGHTPHDTRHTFTSLMNRAEVNDVSIERIVGHRSKGVTKAVYTHKSVDELILAIRKFDTYVHDNLCI
jgi:integrase